MTEFEDNFRAKVAAIKEKQVAELEVKRQEDAEKRHEEFMARSDENIRSEFIKLLPSADDSKSSYDLFRSFLTCGMYSFRQGVWKYRTGEMNEKYEETVVKEMTSLKNKTVFPKLMSILALALEKTPYDFLGTVAAEMAHLDKKWRGQEFTPSHVSALMAGLVLEDVEPVEGKTLLLAEPACGGGSMVIATSEILKEKGFYPWHYFWMSTDVSWNCFAMTYIQLTLLGIPAKVIHGNTISLEVFDESITFTAAMHPPKIPKQKNIKELVMEKWKKLQEKNYGNVGKDETAT